MILCKIAACKEKATNVHCLSLGFDAIPGNLVPNLPARRSFVTGAVQADTKHSTLAIVIEGPMDSRRNRVVAPTGREVALNVALLVVVMFASMSVAK